MESDTSLSPTVFSKCGVIWKEHTGLDTVFSMTINEYAFQQRKCGIKVFNKNH